MGDFMLSSMAMLMLLKGMGYAEIVHGSRSTFTRRCSAFPVSTPCEETNNI
jgi:hypothetical protein